MFKQVAEKIVAASVIQSSFYFYFDKGAVLPEVYFPKRNPSLAIDIADLRFVKLKFITSPLLRCDG